jgi:DNA mismatch repair protein MutS2
LQITITNKTTKDLELDLILNQVADYCTNEKSKKALLDAKPFLDKDTLLKELAYTNEYLASFLSDNHIPNHEFELIDEEIHLLGVEGSYLKLSSFNNLVNISKTVNLLIDFFKKFADYFPKLHEKTASIYYTNEIIAACTHFIDESGEIKDNATDNLLSIRRKLKRVRADISVSFNRELAIYQSRGYLDDIRESVLDNKRVLAVQAMYRKKVKGSILGTSKTGSITFIEPEKTLLLSRELQDLSYDEKQEIVKILKIITDAVRPFTNLLVQYQDFLVHLDMLKAKAKYALSINALLPKINDSKHVYYKDAYHPLLYLQNKKEGKTTIPQTIKLDKNSRIIVISGPNAGGKSITLKTIGLLQVMLQTGLLIPVHEASETTLFEQILTDIGDNQSIENHLSTYSFRLKNMRYFLRKCNANTLFLIDEFGTGSDPELGGALAETFLEEFYEKQSYGIITTHYANLKILANELDAMENANMAFDKRSLEPLFQLIVGEAGSSFTFEVAQKNGIPYSLINRSKKKIERGKIRFDKTIAKLQDERSKWIKNNKSIKQEELEFIDKQRNLEKTNQKLQDKLAQFQELYDYNAQLLNYGKKANDLADKFHKSQNKKQLIQEFMKWVAMVNDKKAKVLKAKKSIKQADLEHLDKPKKATKRQKSQAKATENLRKLKREQLEKEIQEKIKPIRKEKATAKKVAEKAKTVANYNFQVGDSVRVSNGHAVGTIEKINKKKVELNYGTFLATVKLTDLELVKKK